MAQQEKKIEVAAAPPLHGFPPPNMPSLYMDGIANVSPQGGVIKCYVVRVDAEFGGGSESRSQVVAQLVMPIHAFVQTTLFFQKALENLMAQGQIDSALVEVLRENIAVVETTTPATSAGEK